MEAGSLEWKCKLKRFQPCSVPTCSYHDRQAPDITYHLFPVRPKHAHIRHKWVEVIREARNEKIWEPGPDSKICSRHFHPSDFWLNGALRRNLIVERIPSLNLGHIYKKEEISEHCTKLSDSFNSDGRRIDSTGENFFNNSWTRVDTTDQHGKRIKLQDIKIEDNGEECVSIQPDWNRVTFAHPVDHLPDNFEIVPNHCEYSSDEEEDDIGPDPLEGVGYFPDNETQNSATGTTRAKVSFAEVAKMVNTAQSCSCRTTCIVPGCKSRYGATPGISMFRFPKSPRTHQKWWDFIRSLVNDENWVHSSSSTVCSLHFEVGTRSLGARSRLFPNSFPTYCVHPNPNPES